MTATWLRGPSTTDPSPGPTAETAAGGTAGREITVDAADADLATRSVDFDHFYRSNRDSVGRALALTLGDDSLGFEAADEAMARAYERWTVVAGYQNAEGWVYRTGLNWARSWLRRRKRAADKAPLLAQPASGFDGVIDVDLANALSKLHDDHRAVVVLRFYKDWSVEQTAEALDIAPGTVKSRLSRALAILNDEL